MPNSLKERTQTLVTTTVHSLSGRLRRRSRDNGGAVKQRLVVIGNGMVGHRFLRALVERGGMSQYDVTVFGEEPRPAYDRVNLTSLVEHRDPTKLLLSPREWYESNGIDLQTNAQVTAVDTEAREVTLVNGRRVGYDRLVFATGSRPFVPPIPGRDLPNVFVYRTVEDLEAIVTASSMATSAAVIGGGLLGLEAARALRDLGLEVHVVEMAVGLMPQQLDPAGAALLQARVEELGLYVHLGHQTSAIEQTSRQLRLQFAAHDAVTADMVVISTGIRPRYDLAEAAGLACVDRQGIVCGPDLETSVPGIYAIGECACAVGKTYGLAAPGYLMAEALASRMTGGSAMFEGCDLSTRLKMLGVDVAVFGDYLQPGTLLTHENLESYRKLVIREGRLIGAIAVGGWSAAGRLQGEVRRQAKLRPKQLHRFETEGELWDPMPENDISSWPAEAIVCNCMAVSRGTLSAACASGCGTVQALTDTTGAGSVCGSCKPLLAELAGAPQTTEPERATGLLVASGIALLLVLLIGIATPFAYAVSIQDGWHSVDALWRDNLAKQISGYTLLGLAVFGLILSARKRLKVFRLGRFGTWRTIHAAFGVLALGALIAHTGFRFGANLNMMLMTIFVALNLLGGVAGGVAALESRGTGALAMAARKHRRWLTWAHLLLVWPLPAFVGIHIASVYYF